MSRIEFDSPILPEDPQYVPPGRRLALNDGRAEGDCPAVCAIEAVVQAGETEGEQD